MDKVKKLCFPLVIFMISVLISSCAKDEPTVTAPNTPITSDTNSIYGKFKGTWTVDSVFMEQVPTSGSGPSVVMKSALHVYGNVSASSVGYLDITFGAERLGTGNLTMPYLSDAATAKINFKGNTIAAVSKSSFGYDLNYSFNNGSTWYTEYFSDAILGTFIDMYVGENVIYTASQDQVGSYRLRKLTPTSFNIIDSSFGEAYSSPYNANGKNRLTFPSSAIGYYCGQSRLFKSTNGGKTWASARERDNFDEYPYSVEAFDENNITAFFYNNATGVKIYKVVKSQNGGANWTTYTLPNIGEIKDYHFINASTAYLSAVSNPVNSNYPALYRTDDGGATWQVVLANFPCQRLFFNNSASGFSFVNDFLLKTTNAGANWSPYSCLSTLGDIRTMFVYNGVPQLFTSSFGIMMPSGNTDSTNITISGKITNELYKSITRAETKEYYASGSVHADSNRIYFDIRNYSGEGEDFATSGSTFYFKPNGSLVMSLIMANNEKWRVVLHRKTT